MYHRIERRAKLSVSGTRNKCMFACGQRGPNRNSGCFISMCHFILSVSRGSLGLRARRASKCVFTAGRRVRGFTGRKVFLRCSDVGEIFRRLRWFVR